MTQWLRAQERWSPEVVIIFGTAVCYRRATVGSSRGGAYPDKLERYTRGRFVPIPALKRTSSVYSPVRAIIRDYSKRCQIFVHFAGKRISCGRSFIYILHWAHRIPVRG
jgi:hypothetical protein